MTDILTKNRIRTTLTVDGRDCGEWQTGEGTKAGADGKKLSMGAGIPEHAIGGRQTADDISLEKFIDTVSTNAKGGFVNDVELYRWLKTRRGKGRCVVKKQPIDADGAPLGNPLDVLTGILGPVEGPDSDANNSDETPIKVTISTDATIG